jgi:hypothetical protein
VVKREDNEPGIVDQVEPQAPVIPQNEGRVTEEVYRAKVEKLAGPTIKGKLTLASLMQKETGCFLIRFRQGWKEKET